MLFNIKGPADVLHNLDGGGGGQADHALGLDLLNETGDWVSRKVRPNNSLVIIWGGKK